MSPVTVAGLVDALTLTPVGDGSFQADNVESDHGVVFGGQLLGQALVAAVAGRDDGLAVKTLHTAFSRAARPGVGLDIDVADVHSGRTFATVGVTIRQSDRVCVRAQALLSADEPDLIRHTDPAPSVPPPTADDGDGWQIEIVGDVDISDPDAVGPAELDVWTRFPGAPDDPVLNQALLAFATDGFLIGTAMRPHPSVGQAQAHVTLATGVVSHTLTFHEPVDAGGWMLLSHRSPYAGRGRSFGTANVFDADGQLVASYVQDAMIRARDPESTAAL